MHYSQKVNRRRFLKWNVAALAGAVFTTGAIARGSARDRAAGAVSNSPRTSPGFYRFSAGELEITVFNDGFFDLSTIVPPDMEPLETLAVDVEEERREEYFRARLLEADDPRLLISPVLIDSGDRRVLVDTGWAMGEATPAAGRLGAALELVGVSPESIDLVVLTHAHPDHLGGLVDPDTGAPKFPNAEIVLSETEFEFWTGDAAAPALEHPLLAGIPDILNDLYDRLRLIRAGDEVAAGIESISTPGHTPGHLCISLDAGDAELLLTGDALVNIHTSFERPDWQNFFDMNGALAARSRRSLLDRAAADSMLIVGYHFPFPGIGYALRDGNAYRWNPAGTTLLS